MAKEIILITGGTRSGKSRYAEQRALKLGTRRLYVATAQAQDEEMAQRIAEHQKQRGAGWTTIEEPLELSALLTTQGTAIDCALIDCLTLWLSNLLLRGDEGYAKKKVEELLQTLPRVDFQTVLVTNEVGAGIVPDNPLARKFRDLAGWANQRIASLSSEVVLMVAGIPITVKKAQPCS